MVFWWLRILRSQTGWRRLAVSLIMVYLSWLMVGPVPAPWDYSPQSWLHVGLWAHETGWQLKKWSLSDSIHGADPSQPRPSAWLCMASGKTWQRRRKATRQEMGTVDPTPLPIRPPNWPPACSNADSWADLSDTSGWRHRISIFKVPRLFWCGTLKKSSSRGSFRSWILWRVCVCGGGGRLNEVAQIPPTCHLGVLRS